MPHPDWTPFFREVVLNRVVLKRDTSVSRSVPTQLSVRVTASARKTFGRGRSNVLVHPKEVLRIVLALDLGQASKVGTIGVPDTLLSFSAEVVHVDTSGGHRLQPIPKFARPQNICLGFRGVFPSGQDEETVPRSAVAECGLSDAYPCY